MKLGSTVTLAYTGTLEDGTVFGYAKTDNPMVFQTGMDMAIDGFEKAVLEMNEVGEKKTFTLNEYEAYGEYLEGRTITIPLEQVPQGRAVVGKLAYLQSEEGGQPVPATCVGVSDGCAEYDLNHPLAGKRLTFEVELLDMQDVPDGFVPLAERKRHMERQYGFYGM